MWAMKGSLGVGEKGSEEVCLFPACLYCGRGGGGVEELGRALLTLAVYALIVDYDLAADDAVVGMREKVSRRRIDRLLKGPSFHEFSGNSRR